MKKLKLGLFLMFTIMSAFAGDKDSTKTSPEDAKALEESMSVLKKLDSAELSMKYEVGVINISDGVARVNIPKGFKFINEKQSQYILETLWQNPPDGSVLGMIVSDSFHVNSLKSEWVFVISYNSMGYVKDDDADKIDYDDLLKDMKKEQVESNVERKKMGYETMDLLGWASKPYYDKENKVLHWAKEFRVEGNEYNTLNYDVRVLGRKGVLSLNAVAGVDQLEEVKKNIPEILKMAKFESGYTYAEFDSGIDDVAAWTIGGLVAGKVLAKAGFFVVILKFWKLILLAIAGGGSAIWKFVTGRKKKEEELVTEPVVDDNNNNSTFS